MKNGNTQKTQDSPPLEGLVEAYTDHLGNIRLSYTKDPQTGDLKILDESHYYPFGLKHSVYVPAGKKRMELIQKPNEEEKIKLKIVQETDYQYKYQGQERQDELGLNWDSFKWRNYDYAIGRFMSIDPLSEKYAYQSHYNFSENRVIDGRELEGLEWKAIHFDDGDDKGKYFGFQWDPKNAYDDDGNLKEGYYKQALSFIEIPGEFDEDSNFNMGSAVLIVYGEDGNISGIEATTYPADTEQYAVVKSGELYEAVWGQHNGKGPALNLRNTYDVSNSKKNRIPIEQDVHPRFPEQYDSEVGGAYATQINIHWGYGASGSKATTGFDSKGKACSTGCQLVGGNYKDYQTKFIPKLTKGVKVGVTIYRPQKNK